MKTLGFCRIRAAAKALRPTALCLLAVLAAPWCASSARANEQTRRILVLHAYNYMFPTTTVAAESFRKRLQERLPQKVEFDGEYLDLVRPGDPDHPARMVEFLKQKYGGVQFDIVMSMGGQALPFVVKYRHLFAPAAPVLFTGVSPANYSSLQPPSDVTGIIQELDLGKTLDLAERLQPGARRLFVVAGSAQVDRRWQATARKVIADRDRKFDTTFLFELPLDQLLEEVSRIPRDAIVVLLTVLADGNGKTILYGEVGPVIAGRSGAPVYSPYVTGLGRGVLGGFSETHESIGVAAADLALEILSGKDPATIPPRLNPNRAFRVDHKTMQRWNLRESDLPPGTEVWFRDPGIWDEHRDLVLAALLAFSLQTAAVAALLIQRRRRRRAEALLQESEERMTFTAASMNVGLWQFDRESSELWATEHCRALFGLPQDVPLTRETFLAAVHPDDQETAVSALHAASNSDQPAVRDVRVVLPDGKIHWIRVRARSHRDDRGVPDQLSGLFIDVTEQKTAESEAELQRQEVAHLMRVSVLGELSGAIAHEINQPLTAMQSNAETGLSLLAAPSPDLVELRDVLEDIVHDNRRASDVIQRLRNLLRKGERKSEPVDVNDLVGSTVALLNSELIGRHIGVQLDLARHLPSVSGDAVQLQQVLLNLIVNAMDAMAATPAPRRLVTVSTRATPTGAVEVTVKDHGDGIAPAELSRVFEPFHTTKIHGIGLGLTICSTIIQAHGGNLTLANHDQGGITARLLMPAEGALMAAE